MNVVHFDRVSLPLAPFVGAGVFGPVEVHGASYICQAIQEAPSYFDLLSVATAIWATQQGHICAELDSLEKMRGNTFDEVRQDSIVGEPSNVPWPSFDEWERELRSSSLVHCPTSWDEPTVISRPLVYFERRLYLARQWEDERVVARILGLRFQQPLQVVDSTLYEGLFDLPSPEDRQVEAVRKSLASRTSILMGGPGTGKTYTISRILSANLSAHQAESDLPFKVALAAPTAKAAARMRESMTDAVSQEGHPFPEVQVEVLAQLEPLTIHRLLGYRPGSGTRFAHDEKKPLDFDLIIIDEMSMVSMPLMARLLEAVDPRTRLVLVGDPGQLASVENGSILPDLSQLESRFSHSTTTLEISRRNSQSSSSDFTSAVRHGDSERALGIIDTKPDETLKLIESNDGFKGAESQIGEIVKAFVIVQQFASSNRFVDALEATNRMRVVCAHRNGNYGVAIWNKEIAKSIHKKRLNWNVGDIVVKTRNDIANGLSNGENGVVVGQGNDLMFAFRRGSEIVERPVSSVDDVELAYATTVHKAQGSEFGTVVVVVPPKESPLCTRELLYTAATRAKPNLVIIGSRSDIEHAIENQRPRYSGLVDRLRAL